MPTNNDKPIALLINAKTGSPLPNLDKEISTIEEILRATNKIDIICAQAANLSDVAIAINDVNYKNRIAIIHYAGHADGEGIFLESNACKTDLSPNPAYMSGLAKIFAKQNNNRLVFINGCSSKENVTDLSEAGLRVFIATDQGIDDRHALDSASSTKALQTIFHFKNRLTLL